MILQAAAVTLEPLIDAGESEVSKARGSALSFAPSPRPLMPAHISSVMTNTGSRIQLDRAGGLINSGTTAATTMITAIICSAWEYLPVD